ncbi:MAG: methylenetetrahydromethanopterin dehydrogenase [Alphaproteobacteria bacterium]|nr:methylenetetrahydromethanopterin dehydrogenase [Alphaproteobacteria bacterium]
MEKPFILHMLTPLPHMSPFDINMAIDAGYQHVIPYGGIGRDQVAAMVQDAIFSRGPRGAKRTGIFIGGKDSGLALDMLAAAKKAMVPPFAVSVFADPAGAFTTASAMIALVEKQLKAAGAGLEGARVAVFGGKGVVGALAGAIAAGEGAEATLVGYDGLAGVAARAADAKARLGVTLKTADGSRPGANVALAREAEVVLAAARAGVRVLSAAELAQCAALKVAADINAVPPTGIEGIGMADDGKALPGGGLTIGPLAIGNVKYKVQQALFQAMLTAEKPVYLDFREAFAEARRLVAA